MQDWGKQSTWVWNNFRCNITTWLTAEGGLEVLKVLVGKCPRYGAGDARDPLRRGGLGRARPGDAMARDGGGRRRGLALLEHRYALRNGALARVADSV